MVESFLDSNKKKREVKSKLTKEDKDKLLKAKDDFKSFKDLVEQDCWKECVKFIKDEIYEGLALNPGDVGTGDWWLKYCWGLKCFIKRVEGHAKKYDEVVQILDEQGWA